MSLKCMFGAHAWDACKCSLCGKTRDEAHSWAGCKCPKCGHTRDEGHNWSKDCEVCSECSRVRQNAHTWDGCKCVRCGQTRHEWSQDRATCLRCGRALEIATLADLQAINSDLVAHYCLVADIDASETTKWNNGRGFVPVGSKDNPFTGVLHGNGHTIRNLYIKRGGEKEVGLLRILSGSGEVRNLKLVDADVSGMRNVGALVGHSLGRITECYASGKLWCEAGGGGLVGCSAGNITQCNASVVLSGAIVGGLVGFNSGNITKCLTSGEVCGGMAGGLAGGNVGIITECYASGKVSGQPVGGLVGQNDKAGKITESYWDIHATGQQASSGGGLGKTTDEMKRQDTFAGWNFDQTWQIEEAKAYPALRWFAARAVSGRAQAAPGATTAQAGGKCFEPTKNLNSPKLTVDLGVADIRAKAEEGDAQAQVNLGLLYEKGRQGVTQDEVEAVEWYRKAARQNNAEAEWRLGVCYAYGIGVAKDEKMAAELYREAAEQNNAEAQLNLGTCYAFGRCVEADAVEAYKWYLLAAAQDKELGRNIPMVERLMSPEQIAEGRRRAGKFRPK